MMTQEEVVLALHTMEANPFLLTRSVYKGNVELWPNHQMTFVEYHTEYLRVHPNLDAKQYLANLRLMLRKRP